MEHVRASWTALVLLLLTAGVLGLGACFSGPDGEVGVPVVGTQETEGFDHVIIVGVADWSWADIGEATPAVRALEESGYSGSLVDGGPTVRDVDAPVEPFAESTLQGQFSVLSRELEDSDQCLSPVRPLTDFDVRAEIGADSTCAAHLLRASVINPAATKAFEADIADLVENLPQRTLVVVTGYSPSNARSEATLHPILMTDGSAGTGAPRRLRSESTQTWGLVRPADLTATVLANASVSPPAGLSGSILTARAAVPGEKTTATRDQAIAVTVSNRITAADVAVLTVILALAILAGGWWWLRRQGVDIQETARLAVSVVGTTVMATGVSGYAASVLPWWRFGTDPASTHPTTTALGAPLAMVVVCASVITIVVTAAAWGLWFCWVRHQLLPVTVVAAVTVCVLGLDIIRGGPLAMVSVFGPDVLSGGHVLGVGPLAAGLLSTAAMVLAGAGASMVGRLGGSRIPAVVFVLVVGFGTIALIGADDRSHAFAGVPAVLIGTAVLTNAAAGRRVVPSLVFVCGLIATAVMCVLMMADWLRPASDRAYLGMLAQSTLDGRSWDLLVGRFDGWVSTLNDHPESWLVVIVLVAWSYGVIVRSSGLHRQLHPLWARPMMRATCGALIAVWMCGYAFDPPGTPAVGAGLWLAWAMTLSVVAAAQGRSSAA